MKSYRRPQISVLGSVKDLTLAPGSGAGGGKAVGSTDTGGDKTPKKSV